MQQTTYSGAWRSGVEAAMKVIEIRLKKLDHHPLQKDAPEAAALIRKVTQATLDDIRKLLD